MSLNSLSLQIASSVRNIAGGFTTGGVAGRFAGNLSFTKSLTLNVSDTKPLNQIYYVEGFDVDGDILLAMDGASLTNPSGDALSIATVFLVCISLPSDYAGTYLNIGDAAANEWLGPFTANSKITIYPGGSPFLQYNPTGWAVTAGDKLLLSPDVAAGEYLVDILVLGSSS